MLLQQVGTVVLFAALALVVGLLVAARLDRRARARAASHDGPDLQVDQDVAGAPPSAAASVPGVTGDPPGDPEEEEVARPRSRRAPLSTDPSGRPIGDRS